MTNKIIAIVAAVILIVAVIGVIWGGDKGSLSLGGWADSRIIEGGTHYATTTGSYASNVPVQVLERDGSRQYAVFTNPSDTAIYLYFLDGNYAVGEFGVASGETSVTSTITSLNGIYLAANGGRYELLNDNLIIDQVWASSTAVKQINVYYK